MRPRAHQWPMTRALAFALALLAATPCLAGLREEVSGTRLPSGAAGAAWWCSSGWKVGVDTPAPSGAVAAIRVAAARGEAEAVQLVWRPAHAVTGATVSVSALRCGGHLLPASAVEALRVCFVNIETPTDKRGATGLWPDPLLPWRAPCDLAADRNQPVWLRVTAPRDAVAGVYTGLVHLAGAGVALEAPLEVEVFGFDLPARPRCQAALGLTPRTIFRYHGATNGAQQRAVWARYLDTFQSHHIAPYDPAPLDPIAVRWPTNPAEAVQFDFTRWDRAMADALDRRGFTSFRLHVEGLGGGTYYESGEVSLHGHREGTPAYEQILASYLGGLRAHLAEKGWLDEAYAYWFDEPDPKQYAYVLAGFEKLKRHIPGLTRMLTEQPEPALYGGPDLWCPVLSAFDPVRAAERRAAGERFWWYICCAPKSPYPTEFIDHPGTAPRAWLWQTFQHDVSGILIWDTVYWHSHEAYPDAPQDPWADPMSWTTSYGTPRGTRAPWGNGDGRFLYPPPAAASGQPGRFIDEPPADSTRWELLRDGIEDYEYLALLRDRLAAERAPADDPRRALVQVPEDITSSLKSFAVDPAPIERRRETIARALAAPSP